MGFQAFQNPSARIAPDTGRAAVSKRDIQLFETFLLPQQLINKKDVEALRRLLIVRSLLLILVVGLMGCGTNNNDKENTSNEPKNTNESKQMEDFEVTIYAENDESDLNVYATITYIGPEAEKNIYHGGSIFYFNIYQQDGDYEYLGAMNQPLLTTTLIRNEAHRVNFEEIKQLELKPGIYEFEAIANISLDSDNMMETALQIPVSTIKEID